MKKTKLFLILAVVIMALLLAGCRKELPVEIPPVKAGDGLYLKSAAIGEMALVEYLKDGRIEEFKYPNNILFKISGSQAEVLTQKVLLVIKKFAFSDNQAIFSVRGFGSLGSYNYVNEDFVANRLPFSITDFGLQSLDGRAKFNGILKAENYIFAIKDGRIMIYDLVGSRGNKIMTAQGLIQGDVLTFKVNSENWVLKFTVDSPVGNVFELTAAGGKTAICFTLS